MNEPTRRGRGRQRIARDPGDEGRPMRRLGESLAEVGRKLHMGTPQVTATIFRDWEKLVGAAVAAHARPRSLRDGVLTVVVDSPAWATQIRHMEGDIIARLEQESGAAVSGLKVIVDRG